MIANPILTIIGILAGLLAYDVYLKTSMLSAIIVLIFAAWVLFNLKSKLAIWNSISILINPFIMFFNVFLGVFVYYSFQGMKFYSVASRSLGFALIGVAISMFLYKYWNI